MSNPGELQRENQARRDRLSRLSEANWNRLSRSGQSSVHLLQRMRCLGIEPDLPV